MAPRAILSNFFEEQWTQNTEAIVIHKFVNSPKRKKYLILKFITSNTRTVLVCVAGPTI